MPLKSQKNFWLGKAVTGPMFRKNAIMDPQPFPRTNGSRQDLAQRRYAAYARLARTVGLSWLTCRHKDDSTSTQ